MTGQRLRWLRNQDCEIIIRRAGLPRTRPLDVGVEFRDSDDGMLFYDLDLIIVPSIGAEFGVVVE